MARVDRHRRFASVTLTLLVSLSLAGCSHHKHAMQLGLKRITLDLAFKDAKKAAPPVNQVAQVAQPVPAVAEILGTSLPTTAPLAPPAAANPFANAPRIKSFSCPAAPPDARPDQAAPVFASSPPTVGVYFQHNQGTFDLDATVLKLKGPFPRRTDQEIANVTAVDTADLSGNVNGHTITYDVIQRNPLQTVTTTYQSITQSTVGGTNELDLVKVVTQTSNATLTFAPVPAITIMQYKGEGASWKSAGIDPNTGTVMVVQGSIEKKEIVDVCGTLVDTYRVISSEQVTNVAQGYNSQTDANDPNVYNVATQFGGLMVRSHYDTTTTFTVKNVPVTLKVNDTATNDSIKPLPAGTPPPSPLS